MTLMVEHRLAIRVAVNSFRNSLHVRFALIEDEERIHQGVDNLQQMLDL